MSDFPSSARPVGPHGFWTRHPCVGNVVRHLGHLAVLVVGYALLTKSQVLLISLCIALPIVWLAMWRMEIGSLWRTSLVSAMILSAGGIAYLRFEEWGVLA